MLQVGDVVRIIQVFIDRATAPIVRREAARLVLEPPTERFRNLAATSREMAHKGSSTGKVHAEAESLLTLFAEKVEGSCEVFEQVSTQWCW